MGCANLEVFSPLEVTAQIKRWTITNDDIYLLKFKEKPPTWLEDIIINTIEDTGLINDVTNLENAFNNFEEGYTNHFYNWTNEYDTRYLAFVEAQVLRNGEFNSGIKEIRTNYVAKNEAGTIWDSSMGAWMTGAGGAWFNERVSVISNVAYSAAKSASTLTATMQSQAENLELIRGDIDILEKQVDGKVETFRFEHQPTLGAPLDPLGGDIDPDAEPYKTWKAEGTLIEHTGDTFLYTEKINSEDHLIASYRFISSEDASSIKTYDWVILTDDLASDAYSAALAAGILADGKITTYYQSTPPILDGNTKISRGDLWIDSDEIDVNGQPQAKNTMYRYYGAEPFDINDWKLVKDQDITASVNRLDEATVDIAGVATARSALVVDADGFSSGFVASASTDPNYKGSVFKIFADRFMIAATDKQTEKFPFSIKNYPNGSTDIAFNGKVTFDNITDNSGNETDIITEANLNGTLAKTTTIIDGGRITTNSVNANSLKTNTIWVGGVIKSQNFGGIGNAGFQLKANAASTYTDPDIYGAYIRGGNIYGTHIKSATLESTTIKARDLIIVTDAGYPTKSVISGTLNGGIHPYNSTQSSNRLASENGCIFSMAGATVARPNRGIKAGVNYYKGWNLGGVYDYSFHPSRSFDITIVRILVGGSELGRVNTRSPGLFNLFGFTFKLTEWSENIGSDSDDDEFQGLWVNPYADTRNITGTGSLSFQFYAESKWNDFDTISVIAYNI